MNKTTYKEHPMLRHVVSLYNWFALLLYPIVFDSIGDTCAVCPYAGTPYFYREEKLMKKKSLVLLLSAVAVSTGAAGIAGCLKHSHTFSTEWSNDANSHWHAATCEHTDEQTDLGEHSFENGSCTTCGYILYDTEKILKDVPANELCFGASYKLNLPSGKGITLKVFDEDDADEIKGILELTDDMKLHIKGIVRRGYLNFYLGEEKIYSEDVFFNIKTEQLTEKIRAILREKGIDSDIITQTELNEVEQLDLSEHFLNNSDAIGGLQYLTELKTLNLSNNNLKNADITVLSAMKNLTELNLSHNNISDIDGLKSNTKLQTLDLSHNKLDTTGDYNSISSLSRLGRLKYLNLDNNNICNITPISNLTDIVSLKLNSNKITPSSIDSIVGLTSLKEIGLGYNDTLSDLSAFYSLQYIDKLEYVDLSGIDMHGQFGSAGNTKFPSSANLKSLILSSSELIDSDLDDILQFRNLTTLNISGNRRLTKAGLNLFFTGCTQLENVDISYSDIDVLPDLNNLTALKTLKCDHCYNLYDINSLYNNTLPSLTELSLNYCDSIKFSEGYTLHGMDEIVTKLTKLNSLSIINGVHWLTRSTYDGLQEILKTSPDATNSVNANNLEIELFENEKIRYDNVINYPRKIYFGLSELFEDCVKQNNTYTLKYNGKSKCVLSLVNDNTAKNTYATIKIPDNFFEFSVCGTVNESYNFSIEIMDRKKASFDLILDNCILTGNNEHTIIAANQSNVKLTANGERVEIYAPDARSTDDYLQGKNKNAINCYNLELVCNTEKPLIIAGGRGVQGAKGYTSKTNRNTTYLDRKGGKGGNGPAAIICNSFSVTEKNSDNIFITGGKGGLGGWGGDSQPGGESLPWGDDYKAKTSGGDGGDGGTGGAAVEYVESISSGNAVLTGGDGGHPGGYGSEDSSGGYKGPFFQNWGSYGAKGEQTKKINN